MLARLTATLAGWAIRRPRLVVAVAVAVVAAAVPGLLRLEVRTDGHALVPRHDPAVVLDAEVREHFDLRDPIVVLIETTHPDGVYNLDTLRNVRQLSEALATLDGVGPHDIVSLSTERRDRVYPGTLEFRSYLEPLPDTSERMEELRSDIDAAEILTGTLISADERAVNIMVGVPSGANAGRVEFTRRVRELAAPFATETDRVLVVGAPVAEALLGTHVLEDLALLLPLALSVIACVVWLGCRRLAGVALAFQEVGACLLVTFGVMGWLGFPVYLTTAVLPVILTTVGLADEIHIFWHYQRIVARGADTSRRAAVEQTLAEMGPPVVLSSLTTGLAFLSFLASPIAAVWSFGLFAAFGTLFCMVWSLTVIPACLALLPARKMRRPPAAAGAAGRRLRRLIEPLLRQRRRTLGLLLAISVVLGLGVRYLVVQDSWLDGFARDSAFRQNTVRANDLLHGTHTLFAHLTFDPPAGAIPETRGGAEWARSPLLQPVILEAIGDFEAFVRGRPEVGGVLGTHSHLTTVAYLWLGRREGTREIPEHPYLVERVYDRFDRGRGEHRRREVVDDDRRRTVVTIFLEEANYRDTAALMAALRSWVDEHLGGFGVRLDFAGDVAVSQAMIPAIVRTQISSLLLALVGAVMVLSILYRSFKTALLALTPTCFAVLWIFGFMGWFGIPLGVATSMFCAITLGIGVDYGIHLLERVRHATGRPDAVARAIEDAGPAIVADAIAIALGFGLLVVSQVPANARLGILVAAALLAAAVLTLAGLASLLSATAPERSRSSAS